LKDSIGISLKIGLQAVMIPILLINDEDLEF